MTEAGANPYDAVLYPGDAFAQTHPDRLGAIATLFGMQPAPVSHCRMLELGCGVGGNIIPMACQWPDSSFTGIDLSARSIAAGQASCAALGLANIALTHGDIMDVSPALGRFDYIVAHGVYSWVPDAVRRKVLDICRENLAPHGVAFISFNAYPGCHRRNITRDLMRYHVRRADEPAERVRQAREIATLVAAWAPADVYGDVVREQKGWIAHTPDGAMYHDDLAEVAAPFLVHQVAEEAGTRGLQYLGEATFSHSSLGAHPNYIARLIEQIPAAAFLVREQYLDFLVGRTFREALFCHADVALDRAVEAGAMKRFRFCAHIRPGTRSRGGSPAPSHAADSRDDPLSAAALSYLHEIWPQAAAFDELRGPALERAAADGLPPLSAPQLDAALSAALLLAYRSDRIELHGEPPRLTTALSARPRAAAFARLQASAGPRVTSLRHYSMTLESDALRRCLALADGERSTLEIAEELARASPQEPVTVAQTEDMLRDLAKLALLAA